MENIVADIIDKSDHLEAIVMNNVKKKIIPKVKTNIQSTANIVKNNAINQLEEKTKELQQSINKTVVYARKHPTLLTILNQGKISRSINSEYLSEFSQIRNNVIILRQDLKQLNLEFTGKEDKITKQNGKVCQHKVFTEKTNVEIHKLKLKS